MPSRPREFHPEPLTDPDLILSHHPARAIDRRLPPSVGCQALPVASWPDPTSMTRPLRSSPITGPSSLLRVGPPLCPASLLSPSQISCLGFSLQTTGRRPKPLHWPAVPSGRQVLPFHPRAQITLAPPSMPDTHLASQQAPARLLPGQRLDPGSECHQYAFDTSSVVSLSLAFVIHT